MIVFLVGPTAVGKSEVGLRLAEEAGAVILSLDSMQVYQGLDIGTGKPTAGERARVPHGGLDLVPWWERLDTARYLEAVAPFLQTHAGKTVYIVGGTGLYFRALIQGLSAAPAAPPALRAELAALPLDALQARLRAADPEQELAFDWQNPRRLQRSIEVIESTGISLREWHRRPAAPPLVTDYRAFFLQRERDDLRERIARRTERMFAAGWIDEVRGLAAARGAEALRDSAAIGYGAIADALAHGQNPSFLQVPIVDATRQYAKRQLTWFNRESTVQPLMIPPAEPADATAARLRALLSPVR